MFSKILFEDNHILIVEKSSHCHPNESLDECRYRWEWINYLRSRNQKAKIWLKNIESFNSPTGGVIIYAKSSKAYLRLRKQINKREIQQLFFMVVTGTVHKHKQTITSYLYKDEKERYHVVSPKHPNGRQTSLSYFLIDQCEDLYLIAVPSKSFSLDKLRLLLHAHGINIFKSKQITNHSQILETWAIWRVHSRFCHPTKYKKYTFNCTPPHIEPWHFFNLPKPFHQLIRTIKSQF